MNLMLEKLYQHFEKKGICNIWKIFKSYMDNCGLGMLLKDEQLVIEILHYCCVYFVIFWCWGITLALILWQNDAPQPLSLFSQVVA